VSSGSDSGALAAVLVVSDLADDEAAVLMRRIRAELGELDVDIGIPSATVAAPSGSKGVESMDWATLLVTMSAAGGVFPTVLMVLRDVLGRRKADGGKVTVTIDGDSLEIDGARSAERDALIRAFVERHGTR
jgi:hypothetical protein